MYHVTAFPIKLLSTPLGAQNSEDSVLSFSAKRERKGLLDAANHVQQAVWKWFPVPSAASLQQLSRLTESKSSASAWKIQNRQIDQNSV